ASDVMAGYGTLFEEFFDQIFRPPDLLFVQAGVGGLSAAAASSLRRISATARVVVVEPEGSNAIALSFASGAPVSVPDTPTVMACLRCQSASFVAWPILLAGIDAAMVVTDEEAAAAVRELARRGVIAGASGAAGLARAPLEPGRPADPVPRTCDVGRIRVGRADTDEDPNVPQSRDLERPLMVPEREVTDAKRVWLGARGYGVCPR